MRRLFAGLLLLIPALAGCGQWNPATGAIALVEPTPPNPATPTAVEPVADLDSFTEALRVSGVAFEPQGGVSLAFLKVDGLLLEIGDERVQVYEYAGDADARADAARFSSDGAWVSSDIGATLVNWIATPHLYRASRLIAVYVGDHLPTLALLEGILGAPFAGGANPYHTSVMPVES